MHVKGFKPLDIALGALKLTRKNDTVILFQLECRGDCRSSTGNLIILGLPNYDALKGEVVEYLGVKRVPCGAVQFLELFGIRQILHDSV